MKKKVYQATLSGIVEIGTWNADPNKSTITTQPFIITYEFEAWDDAKQAEIIAKTIINAARVKGGRVLAVKEVK